MSTFRFLHSADLHLGRAFGGYPEGIRHMLREARHGAIARLVKAARTGGHADRRGWRTGLGRRSFSDTFLGESVVHYCHSPFPTLRIDLRTHEAWLERPWARAMGRELLDRLVLQNDLCVFSEPIRVAVLNGFTALGIPVTEAVG